MQIGQIANCLLKPMAQRLSVLRTEALPGASTAVSIMLDLLKKCFPSQTAPDTWQSKLKEMIPSYGSSLGSDAELLQRVREWTGGVLRLPPTAEAT